MSQGTFRYLGTGIALVALIALWSLFGPAQLGGAVTYVTTHGESMEPKIEQGDLVLVRSADTYEVGDVVAFRSENLNQIVLHRIIDTNGDRFVTQGDNNDWVDSEEPASDAVIGKLWMKAPALGGFTQNLRSPKAVAIAVGLIALMLFASGGKKKPAGERAQKRRGPRFDTEQALTYVIAVGGAFALLAGLAFARPVQASEEDRITYLHEGRFSYSADVAPSAVYPNGKIETGDPVFLRLADRVDVAFDYDLRSDLPVGVHGEAHFEAMLGDPAGWHRTFELAEPVKLGDPKVRLEATLDLARMRDLIDRVEKATALPRDSYPLALVPRIEVAGTMGDHEIAGEFAPRLDLQLDALQLQQLPAAAATPGTEPVGDPLKPELEGSVSEAAAVDGYVTLLGTEMRVATLRIVAVVGVAISLLLGLALFFAGHSSGRPALGPSRYRHMMIPVGAATMDAYERVVEVEDVDSLASLAKQRDKMMLSFEKDGVRHLLVDDAGVAYVAKVTVEAATAFDHVASEA